MKEHKSIKKALTLQEHARKIYNENISKICNAIEDHESGYPGVSIIIFKVSHFTINELIYYIKDNAFLFSYTDNNGEYETEALIMTIDIDIR